MTGSYITDTGLKTVASHCSALQHLNVSCCRFITELSLELLASCSGLQLVNASYITEHITNDGLEAAITQLCPGLLHLSICGWDKITKTGVETLLQHYPGLQYLHCDGSK